MIIEFTTPVPIQGSSKSFRPGQRFVFERDRAERYIAQGQAREVGYLYKDDEPVKIVRKNKELKKNKKH